MSFAKALSLLLLAVLALGFLTFGPALLGSNFRTVVSDRVYRSGQLDPDELEERIQRHGLRAIINLRGDEEDREWYRAEAAVARRHDVILHDLDLVPERQPPRPAVVSLMESLETLPEPILIHCRAGADRTGFASVVAKMALGGTTFGEARRELSVWYGHLPFGPAAEIGRIFDQYEAHLRESRTNDRFDTFERWAQEIYVPYVYSARLESETLPSEVAAGERLDLRLLITNTSPGPWVFSSDVERGVKLGVQIREGDGDWLDYDRHGQSDRTVHAGETLNMAASVWAPKNAGTYELKLDLVDEHVTWFEDQGSSPLVWPLVVKNLEANSGL